MTRPIIFMDVDGVILPFGCVSLPAKEDIDNPEAKLITFRRSNGSQHCFKITVNHDIIARVLKLKEYADIVWATLWDDNVSELVRIIPELEFIEPNVQLTYRMYNTGKTEGIIDHIIRSGNRPFCWIDDTAIPYRWYGNNQLSGIVNQKLVNPLSEVGLTDDHVTSIIEWIDTL